MKMTLPCASRSSRASKGTAVSCWSVRLKVGEVEGSGLSLRVEECTFGSGSVYRRSLGGPVAFSPRFAGVFVEDFACRDLGPEKVQVSLWLLRLQ